MSPQIARYLAPAALGAVVIAVVVVLGGGGGGAATRAGTAVSSTIRAPRSKHRFWIVRGGQSLSLIAVRTGVSVDQIRRLNPGKDLSILLPGQYLKVRS